MSAGDCPECGQLVAKSAFSCPGCGNRNFKVTKKQPTYGECPQCYGSGVVMPDKETLDEYNEMVEKERRQSAGNMAAQFFPSSLRFKMKHAIKCDMCNGSRLVVNGYVTVSVDCRGGF